MPRKEIHEINPQQVKVDERVRQKFDKEAMNKLVASFKKFGQKQPGVCRTQEEEVWLVAGERRLRAAAEADINFQYILEEDADEITLLEIELDENLCRENLTWQEECSGLLKLQNLRESQQGEASPGTDKGYSLRDMSKETGRSPGKLHSDLELAQFAEAFSEVKEAKTKNDAKKVIKKIREQHAQKKAIKELEAKEEEEKVDEGETEGEPEEKKSPEDQRKDQLRRLVRYYKERIYFGSMEEKLLEFEDESFDIVFFDPPWGIDYDSQGRINEGREKYEDSLETYVSSLKNYLDLLWTKMKPDSHLYMFFGIINHSLVYTQLEASGFTVNWMPVIWNKMQTRSTRAPDVWPGHSYEPIAYARKGSKPLVIKGGSDVISTPSPTPTMKKYHPSAKHPSIFLELLKRSAQAGDKILDPMCGSGMLGVAAETFRSTLRLNWHMIEKEESFYNLSITNCIRGYSEIVQEEQRDESIRSNTYADEKLPYFVCECGNSGEVKDLITKAKSGKRVCRKCGGGPIFPRVRDLPEDFRELPLTRTPAKPPLWKAYWMRYPEKQKEMLDWKAEQEGEGNGKT